MDADEQVGVPIPVEIAPGGRLDVPTDGGAFQAHIGADVRKTTLSVVFEEILEEVAPIPAGDEHVQIAVGVEVGPGREGHPV